jgi:hypothetical protein
MGRQRLGRMNWLALLVAATSACAAPLRVSSRPAPTISPSAVSLAGAVAFSMSPRQDLLKPVARAQEGYRIWLIERGTYAGMSIPVRSDVALGAGRNTEHFWRAVTGAGSDGGVVGWNSDRYPIPVALRHGASSERISAADSVAFWSVLEQMSADLGMVVFTPVTIDNAADPVDTIVVDVRFMPVTDGLSRTTWMPSGEVFDVRVTFQSAEVLHDGHVVTHEMMHALGFGHTRAWSSVLNPGESSRPSRLTPEDVAYTEAGMELQGKGQRAELRRRIALAIEREPGSIEAAGSQVLDGPEPPSIIVDRDNGQDCAHVPAVLIAVVPACGRGLR